MLVDHIAESQSIPDYDNGVTALRDYPRITESFTGSTTSFVTGDLTSVYKGKLSHYTRSVLFLGSDLFFLYDRVKSQNAHEYNWLFHAEHTNGKNSINWHDGAMTIIRPKANLRMDVISPEIVSYKIKDSDRDEGFIMLNSDPAQSDASFLGVMNPGIGAKPDGTFRTSRIDADGWIGTEVDQGKLTTVAGFSLDEAITMGRLGGYVVEAQTFAVTIMNDLAHKVWVHGKSVKGNNFTFSADKTVRASLDYRSHEILVEVDTPEVSKISISVPRPVTIVTNHVLLYDATTETATITVPEGFSSLSLKM